MSQPKSGKTSRDTNVRNVSPYVATCLIATCLIAIVSLAIRACITKTYHAKRQGVKAAAAEAVVGTKDAIANIEKSGC